MTKDEALKLALEAMECALSDDKPYLRKCEKAITAIREALAEQEPVAMRYDFDGYGWKYIDSGSGSDWKTRIKGAESIYTSPPASKPWVGLTDEEIEQAFYEFDGARSYITSFAHAIEAKLKQKNGYAEEKNT